MWRNLSFIMPQMSTGSAGFVMRGRNTTLISLANPYENLPPPPALGPLWGGKIRSIQKSNFRLQSG